MFSFEPGTTNTIRNYPYNIDVLEALCTFVL